MLNASQGKRKKQPAKLGIQLELGWHQRGEGLSESLMGMS
jgi:hypothetical protein